MRGHETVLEPVLALVLIQRQPPISILRESVGERVKWHTRRSRLWKAKHHPSFHRRNRSYWDTQSRRNVNVSSTSMLSTFALTGTYPRVSTSCYSNDYSFQTCFRFAVRGQSFVVNFFLGDVPSTPSTWQTAPNALGVVSIFGGGQFLRGTCSNCAQQAQREDTRLVTGQISITSALLNVIESGREVEGLTLKSLDKAEVGAYLKKVLHWRVSTVRYSLT